MILTDTEIRDAVASGELKIVGFDDKHVEAASYDMTVGPEGFTTSGKRRINIIETGFLLLRAGDYGLVTTNEAIELPANFVARFGLRSHYLRKGLFASVGPQIDPGYRGRLILGLMNLSPSDVVLGYKEPLVSVEFHRLRQPAAQPYAGPYQDKLCITSEDIEPLMGNDGLAFSEILTTLRSLNSTVGQLTQDMSTLKWWTVLVIGAGFALTSIVVGVIALSAK